MLNYSVKRLTQPAYDALKDIAATQPELWLDPHTDFEMLLLGKGLTDYSEDTGAIGDAGFVLEPALDEPSNRRHRSDRQALDYHDSFDGISPSMATDGNMWTWMNHFRLHSYSIDRWAGGSTSNLTRFVHSHWFVEDQRDALVRNNAAGRTWWLAHVARTAAKHSGGAFTELDAINLFANAPRYYHNCMSSVITRNPDILAEVVRSLLTDAEGIKTASSDEVWKHLNLAAGTMVLDAMPRESLRLNISNFVEGIMSDEVHVADRTKLRNRKPLLVLSLGAGVQSTVLALMADRGEFGLPKPDLAIFADTGWEPKAVYEHLKWLRKELSFDVVTVGNGNIRENILAGRLPNNSSHLGIPAFTRNQDGSKGILRRQCTAHYKMQPIHKYLRDYMELEPGRRAPKDKQVEMWLGISVDEQARQKPSQEEWITKRYPLIEHNLSRAQLQNWFESQYSGRTLPKSSCIGCPYHDDSMWKSLKEGSPAEFQDAVFIDTALRNLPDLKGLVDGDMYLHPSRKPLVEVDFSEAQSYEDVMMDECEGVCGV